MVYRTKANKLQIHCFYKEWIDSLFSYQKKLHEIISTTKKPEVQLRAISELHSIEVSMFSLWKQLPDVTVVDSPMKEDNSRLPYPALDWPNTRHVLEKLLQQRDPSHQRRNSEVDKSKS